MGNFIDDNGKRLSSISTIVTIVTIIFTAGIFYQNNKGLNTTMEKERQDRQNEVKMINDRIKGIELQTITHFQEYKYDFDDLKDQIFKVKKLRNRVILPTPTIQRYYNVTSQQRIEASPVIAPNTWDSINKEIRIDIDKSNEIDTINIKK